MKIKVKYGDGVISVPGEVYSQLKKATGNDAKVIFALLKDTNPDIKKISSDLGMSETDVMLSLGFWRGTGIIEITDEENEKKSREPLEITSTLYTSDDIEKVINGSPEINAIIQKCEAILGKTFSSSDDRVIVYLYDHLGLDAEYILLVFTYCRNKGHSSMKYIESTAIKLYDRGIDTSDALQRYISDMNKTKDTETFVRSLFGMGERKLSPSEEAIIENWTKKEYSSDLLSEAYNRMVDKISKPTLKYMDKILENWNASNIKTVGDLKKQDSGKKKKRTGAQEEEKSFDIDDFFKKNLNRIDND